MSTAATHTTNATTKAGFPPAPSEAHQRAKGVLGQKRSVVMNGSRLDLEHDGKQWRVVKVTAA